MYAKKRNKVCPFCQNKVKLIHGAYKCDNCGAEIKPEALDTKALNSSFFSIQR